MTPQTLIFDLDDTLIHCNLYFIKVIDEFAGQMAEWFKAYSLSAERIKSKQAELDLTGVHKHGLIKERFPRSLAETYLHFAGITGRLSSFAEIRKLFQMGHSVYAQPFEPYPDMEETLNALANQGHHLCLFTGGDREVQMSKISKLNLQRYFGTRIFITSHKDTHSMARALSEWDADRSVTWMIGNSARTDILPALENGIHAIHIPCKVDWEYNLAELPKPAAGKFYRLSLLRDVPQVIAKHCRH